MLRDRLQSVRGSSCRVFSNKEDGLVALFISKAEISSVWFRKIQEKSADANKPERDEKMAY